MFRWPVGLGSSQQGVTPSLSSVPWGTRRPPSPFEHLATYGRKAEDRTRSAAEGLMTAATAEVADSVRTVAGLQG